MSQDIYDESNNLKNPHMLALNLLEKYKMILGGRKDHVVELDTSDSYENRIRMNIANFQADTVSRIIQDAATMMIEHNISPYSLARDKT